MFTQQYRPCPLRLWFKFQFKMIASKAQIETGKAGKCEANILKSNLFIMYEALMLCCDVWRCFLQSKSNTNNNTHTYAKWKRFHDDLMRKFRILCFDWVLHIRENHFRKGGNSTRVSRKLYNILSTSVCLIIRVPLFTASQHPLMNLCVNCFREICKSESFHAHRAPLAYKKSINVNEILKARKVSQAI